MSRKERVLWTLRMFPIPALCGDWFLSNKSNKKNGTFFQVDLDNSQEEGRAEGSLPANFLVSEVLGKHSFAEVMAALDEPQSDLYLTDNQVRYYCENYGNWLRPVKANIPTIFFARRGESEFGLYYVLKEKEGLSLIYFPYEETAEPISDTTFVRVVTRKKLQSD